MSLTNAESCFCGSTIFNIYSAFIIKNQELTLPKMVLNVSKIAQLLRGGAGTKALVSSRFGALWEIDGNRADLNNETRMASAILSPKENSFLWHVARLVWLLSCSKSYLKAKPQKKKKKKKDDSQCP